MIGWLATLSCCAAAALGGEASLALGSTARRIDRSGATAVASTDLTLRPRVTATAETATTEARLAYQPTLRLPRVGQGEALDTSHALDLRLSTRLSASWRVEGRAAADRGRVDRVAEALRDGTDLEVVQARFLSTTRQAVDASVEGVAGPRLRLRLLAGWFTGGGLDAESRAIFPTEHGLRARGELEWRAAPRDRLSLGGDVLARRLVIGDEGAAATLLLRWRRELTRELEGWAGAGVGLAWEDAPFRDRSFRSYPAAALGLQWITPRVSLVGEARLTASVDRITARDTRQAEAFGSARLHVARTWALLGAAQAVSDWYPEGVTRRGAGELRVEWQPTDAVNLSAGPYARWQGAGARAIPFQELGLLCWLTFSSGHGPWPQAAPTGT